MTDAIQLCHVLDKFGRKDTDMGSSGACWSESPMGPYQPVTFSMFDGSDLSIPLLSSPFIYNYHEISLYECNMPAQCSDSKIKMPSISEWVHTKLVWISIWGQIKFIPFCSLHFVTTIYTICNYHTYVSVGAHTCTCGNLTRKYTSSNFILCKPCRMNKDVILCGSSL